MTRALILVLIALLEFLILGFVWLLLGMSIGEHKIQGFGEALSQYAELGTNVLEALLDPRQWSAVFGSGIIWLVWGMPCVVSLASAAFVWPLAPKLSLSTEPRSMHASVIAAGLVGAMLSIGVLTALIEVAFLMFGHVNVMAENLSIIWLVVALALGWTFWTWLLWQRGVRVDHGVASKLLRLIFRGTLVEMAVVIPAYAYSRSRDDCFCEQGTFWGLACGLGGLFFLAGPGALLLWYQRTGRWVTGSDRRCGSCGYQQHARASDRCPECGAEWKV